MSIYSWKFALFESRDLTQVQPRSAISLPERDGYLTPVRLRLQTAEVDRWGHCRCDYPDLHHSWTDLDPGAVNPCRHANCATRTVNWLRDVKKGLPQPKDIKKIHKDYSEVVRLEFERLPKMTSKEDRLTKLSLVSDKVPRSAATKSSRGSSYMEAKRNLKCGICSEKFVDPRMLTCLHSFCFNCIRRLTEKGKYKKDFPCPLCNRTIEIPKGGIKALKPNLYLAAAEPFDKTPLCDICDTGTRAVERCLECEENLCSSCMNYHSKMKATRTHRTAQMGSDPAKSKPRIQQKQYCEQHDQEEIRFYCVPCGKMICRDCKTLNHTVHQTLEISEVAAGRKREIGMSLRMSREYLPKINSHIKVLHSMTKSLEKNTQTTTKDIKDQTKKMHTEIDRMANEMISQIKQKNKELENTLQRNIKSAEVVHASIESIIMAAESFMNVGSDHDVIENSVNTRARIDNLAREIPEESVEFLEFQFMPGPIPSTDLWGCFGTWTSDVATTASITLPSQVRPAMALVVRELSSFEIVGGQAIISIATTKEGDAWICNSLSEHVFHYSRSGQCKAHVKCGSEVGDVYVTSDSSIMMSFPTLRKIKRMSPGAGHNLSDFCNTPTYPSGLAQTDAGEILVCAMEKLGESVRGPESRGSILRITSFGRVEKFDKERQVSLFSRPIRIAVNVNRDICVSDWTKGHDHVICLTSDGRMKWKYFGPKTIQLPEPFVPNAIACDKYCQVLIADSHNRAIHLVDKDGRFVKLLLTEKDGLGEPWAVAVDNEGFLWVGDTEGTVKVYKYMT